MNFDVMLRRADLAGLKLSWVENRAGWSCTGSGRRGLVCARGRTGAEALAGVLRGLGLA